MEENDVISQKTLLITGGTGFIGQFLVPELLKDNWTVVVFSRQSSDRVARTLGDQVQSIQSFDQWPFPEGPDACINLAGEGIVEKRWSSSRKQILRESRINLTSELVEWLNAQDKTPKVFISGSAVGYYGPQKPDDEITEMYPAGDDFAAELCSEWEQAAQTISDDCRLCLLRTGVVLHPKYGALAKMLPAFKMGVGGPIGSGQQVMPWIHIEDMVRGILFLLDTPDAQGPFNLVAPKAVDNRTFSKALGNAVKRPAFFTVPGFMMKLMLGDASALLLEGQRPISFKLEYSGFTFLYPELEKALESLLPR
ncbi:TIGR01777 family oxidoreductase [Sansalvadorimonas sp. 2012CJ34-2]|uniref:TIGR01777 family oxidoreductase n=1 Tax=Parendozoicomonas callyspongiae TaxID=2942213 RepID=A0ABT0PJD4_9GAMM|nr:TIGR01777 family oxidoreductase [Sansalvadorimonas sp. 2012CJ34-2]MCL6271495.1 TIGR01777 family oxidoreductase [Sansalvadorimonas sp. 2012CJ34-2]